MATALARQKAAQAWCTEKTSNIVMDPVLAEAFAEIIDEILKQPWLGNATSKELLEELGSRLRTAGIENYRTVDEN